MLNPHTFSGEPAISIFDAEAERFKLVRTVSVRGTGIHAIYTRHDSNHIIFRFCLYSYHITSD